MLRFWLFTFGNYYPRGGMADFNNSYETAAESIAAGEAWCKAQGLTRYHVYDSVDRKVLGTPDGSQFYDYEPCDQP